MCTALRYFTSMLLAVAVGATFASSASAASITIDEVGDTFTVDWSGTSSSGVGCPAGGCPVSVSSLWTVDAFNTDTNSVTFDISMTNTTPASTGSASLTGFGFNTNPDVTGGTETSAIWNWVSVIDQSGLDVCVENDANDNCEGNSGNGGLVIGATDTFSLTLNFSSSIESGVSLSDFFARLQSIGSPGEQSAKLTADAVCIDCDGDLPLTPVPEPSTVALLGLGVAALALARRRARPVR